MAKNKPYRYALYLLCRALAGFFLILPKAIARGLAVILAWLGYALITRHRRKTLENLNSAFRGQKSEKEILQMARKVFENLGLVISEILRFPRLTQKEALDLVDAGDAFKIYDDLLKEGKGLISVTAHLGNWELLAGIFGLQGYQGAVLARRIYYEPYNRFIVGLRQKLNVRTIYRNNASREILAALAKNQIIGLLPDQDIDSLKGIFVDYFGRPAYTSIAPAKLSLASGAPIVVNFLVRTPNGRYKIVMGEIIRPRYDKERQEAIREMTEKWMHSFEKVIREYPEQWAWMHNRWKTQLKNNAARGRAHSQPQSHAGLTFTYSY